jgi:hypothetical protein
MPQISRYCPASEHHPLVPALARISADPDRLKANGTGLLPGSKTPEAF